MLCVFARFVSGLIANIWNALFGSLNELHVWFFQASSSLRVEDLENLYSTLVRCVYRHQSDYDKTNLIKVRCYEILSYLLCDVRRVR